MKFGDLVALTSREPVFRSGLLLSGNTTRQRVRLQLSRWVRSGRILQLRRGLYVLAPPWRAVEPHPFLVSNRLQQGSVVSLQSALSWYGLIPEHVPVVTGVGPGRPETVNTPLGRFRFHHLSPELTFGYSRIEVSKNQTAFVAYPEKALLDLIHLTPGGDSVDFLQELRLQNVKTLNFETMDSLVQRSGKPKLARAAMRLRELLVDESEVIL